MDQCVGICHRLFCFIMKTFAAQAIKTITLGPSATNHHPRSLSTGHIDHRSKFPLNAIGVSSIDGAEDSESLASIDIEDETRALLDDRRKGCWEGERKLMAENGTKTKATRKMVSIKDEPEIIRYPNKKRRKSRLESQISSMKEGNKGDVRPLRSILKVGSN